VVRDEAATHDAVFAHALTAATPVASTNSHAMADETKYTRM